MYVDRDLHAVAAAVVRDDVVAARGAADADTVDRGDMEEIDKPLPLSITSSVSKSSSPTLLDAALLLAGDWGILRRPGADLTPPARGLYTHRQHIYTTHSHMVKVDRLYQLAALWISTTCNNTGQSAHVLL